jgi:hypothetical protein
MPCTPSLSSSAAHKPLGLASSTLPHQPLGCPRGAARSLRRQWTTAKPGGRGDVSCNVLPFFLDLSLAFAPGMEFFDAVKSSVDSEVVFQATLQVRPFSCLMVSFLCSTYWVQAAACEGVCWAPCADTVIKGLSELQQQGYVLFGQRAEPFMLQLCCDCTVTWDDVGEGIHCHVEHDLQNLSPPRPAYLELCLSAPNML